jgi:hypothetical protein
MNAAYTTYTSVILSKDFATFGGISSSGNPASETVVIPDGTTVTFSTQFIDVTFDAGLEDALMSFGPFYFDKSFREEGVSIGTRPVEQQVVRTNAFVNGDLRQELLRRNNERGGTKIWKDFIGEDVIVVPIPVPTAAGTGLFGGLIAHGQRKKTPKAPKAKRSRVLPQ